VNAKEAQKLTEQAKKNIENKSRQEVVELLEVIYSRIKVAALGGENSTVIIDCFPGREAHIPVIVINKLQIEGFTTIREGMNSLLISW
jgi:hypothetical protein